MQRGQVMATRNGGGVPKMEDMTKAVMANILGLDKSYSRSVYPSRDGKTCIVFRVSPVTKDLNKMILGVPAMRVESYFMGLENGLIQEVFPELSATEREFLMTGMTSQDWDDTFADEAAGKESEEKDTTKCQHCGEANH